ncbi:MAG TPA: DUF222 domain-containing protein [Candidatus Dormibacteraeota bacterium]|nr:DUF222 domain-containing protein [Candidatus Dormibacteraeota bacterium]
MIAATEVLALEERAERLIQRRHAIDLLELEWAQEAACLAASEYSDYEGFATPLEWIRISCKLTGPQAADRVAVGRQMAALPESVAALLAGEIGFAHLMVMARTAQALKRSLTATAFDERLILDQARQSTVGKLYYDCQHLRHAQDPQGYAGDEAEAVEARSLKIKSGGNGMASIKGLLDSGGAATLRRALEPLARKAGADDQREPERRLADALVELAGGGRPAQLQVTTSIETLMGLAGAPAAEMEFSLPISAKTVERMACDCSVVRVLMAADSAVIDVGRSTRKISAALRRGLHARDGGCRWPGCDRPACSSQGHHLRHWIQGGPTQLDNLVLLCYHHHRKVHEGGWQLVKCDDGRLLTIAPPTRFRPWSRSPD